MGDELTSHCAGQHSSWSNTNVYTTFSNGCLGSHNDEERSEMRYVMRIAGPRESSKFWTHIVLPGYAWLHARLSVLVPHLAVTLVCWHARIWYCLCTIFNHCTGAVFKYNSDPNGEEDTLYTHLLLVRCMFSCACEEGLKPGSISLWQI